jgi:dipeptidyl aminopeptidase/acylaminoacyl peptidase
MTRAELSPTAPIRALVSIQKWVQTLPHALSALVLTGFIAAGAATLAFPHAVGGQLLEQSPLTFEDRDPSFRITLDHLAEDLRWMGVPPRQLTWDPGGDWLYFRWREDPEPEQHPDTDPWYAVNRQGTDVRRVDAEEAALIPAGSTSWSADRRVAAWSRDGTLFVWTAAQGTRPAFTADDGLGNVRTAASGDRVTFSVTPSGRDADLWEVEVEGFRARRLVRMVAEEDEEPPTEAARWLHDQQRELLETVRRDERRRAAADSVRRSLRAEPVLEIPLGERVRAHDLQVSPDGAWVTFRWEEEPSTDRRTSYMDFVHESGYATELRARPKVGEPLSRHRMGIVAYEPGLPADSVVVTWVEAPTEKEAIVHGPYWNPQGTAAVVQILSMDHKERWIAGLDPSSGQVQVLDHQEAEAWIGGPLVGGRWAPGWLEWLPEGDAFAFVSEATGWAMLHLAALDGNVERLTEGEWEVRGAELSPDGRRWHLTTSREHPGEEQFYHLPVRGGELVRITPEEGTYGAVVSPDGRRVATTFESDRFMPDLYVLENRPGADKARITKSGTDDYFRIPWVATEIRRHDDPAGEDAWVEIYDTPDDANRAAVLYAHGCGECAQGVVKAWSRVSHRLYGNYLYQRGYTFANLDYRGSWGYGHANRTYAYRQMGISDVDSSLPVLDILAGERGVDPGRIGVYGGSYGGFFTLMSLLRHPDRFAAGVAIYPVADWAHYNHGYTSRILNGAPYEDEEAYRVSSPIYYVDGPYREGLQIQHGLLDGNVQIQDVFRLTQVMMEHDRDFDLVVYPVEAHGWSEEPTRRDSFRRMTRWWETHLLDDAMAADH